MSGAEMPNIGDILKARREELGLTVEVLATRTRIRRVFLLALEENRFDGFPGEAYLAGFLRVYASALGLQSDQLTAIYRQQVDHGGAALPEKPEPVAIPLPQKRRRHKFGSWVWAWLAVAALVVSALALVSLTMPKEAERGLATVSTEAARPPATANAGEAIETTADAPIATPDSPAPAEVARESDSASATPKTLVTVPSSLPVPSPAGAATASSPSVPAASVAPLTFFFPGNGEIRLQALGPNQIEVRSDNRPVQNYNLTAAAILSWKVQNSARIRVESPGEVKVWLDDQPLDLQGRSEFILRLAETSGGR